MRTPEIPDFNPSGLTEQERELLLSFSVRDWADAILVSPLAFDTSTPDYIRQDAIWASENGAVDYRLQRVDYYDDYLEPPLKRYRLEVRSITGEFVGYQYWAKGLKAQECDEKWKVVPRTKRRVSEERMIAHLRTAPINYQNMSSRSYIESELRTIRDNDFSRRHRVAHAIKNALSFRRHD